METETIVSTPEETSSVDTSTNTEPTDVDTSVVEPTIEEVTAETETGNTDVADVVEEPKTEKLYAGKYKSVEELEKGYEESQKAFNQVAELKKQIEAMNNAQVESQKQAQMEALKQAQQRGFNSVEQQEISDKVQVAELEYYANNLDQVNPQDYETVRNYLANYYNTGSKEFLNEAKKYFTSDFVEKVALAKNDLKARLQAEFDTKNRQLFEEKEQRLADEIKGVYGEFLTSIKDNEPVARALEMFCNTGHIQSKEDMQVFVDIIGAIKNTYTELAIKEYEAQKAIEATKQASQIEANSEYTVESNRIPTYDEIAKMGREEYARAVEKYGLDKILQAQ